MNKENRWLLIFAGIFLVVGIAASLLIGVYMDDRRDEKLLRDYEDLFPTAEKVEVKKLKGKILTDSYKFIDSRAQNLGTVYVGGGTATGIYYYALGNNEDFDKNEKYNFLMEVIVNPKDEIDNVRVKESEHTPDFVEIVENYFANLKGEKLEKYKFVDEIAGASDFTMPIVRDVLTAVVKAHLDKEPLPKPEISLEPHEEIFGVDTIYEEVEDFIGTEEVTNKGLVKDELGNTLGYAYTGTVITDIERVGEKKLSLLVGIDNEGKIAGFAVILNEHTAGYYERFKEDLSTLIGSNPEDLNVDNIADSTGTATGINDILNAVKAVIANEEPIVVLSNYEKLFGEGATEVAEYETSVIESVEVISGSVDSEIFVTKENVYDQENNLLGYAYTGKANTDLIPSVSSADLVLLVGINLEGKVVGVIIVKNEHTPGYFSTWLISIDELKDVDLIDLKVDGISGATVSRGFINGIFGAIQGVIANE